MKKCSKPIYALTAVTIVCILLILFNLPKEQDKYLTLLPVDDFQIENTGVNTFFGLGINHILEPTCPNTSALAILIITSYFGHVELRSSIRRTFSDQELASYGVKRIFLLGKAPNEKYTKQKQIEDEHKRFGDILQGSFNEAYKNLTYKHLMGLSFASKCTTAKFIIKMDDDIVVDLVSTLALVRTLNLPENLLAGYALSNMKPIRLKANKWYVSFEEYEDPAYPTFLSGWLYVTNRRTATKLINCLEDEKYFWIDDLFITGILARKAKISHYSLNKYYATNAIDTLCCLKDMEEKRVRCDTLIGPNGSDNNLFYKFNEAVKRCAQLGCNQDTNDVMGKKINEEKCDLEALQSTRVAGKSIVEDFRLS